MKKDFWTFCKSNGKFPRKYSSFFIKFFIFSAIFYLIWTLMASAYFSLILKITTAYFGFIGIEISFNPTHDFLYSQGIRSSIPPYIALILATNLSFGRLRSSIASQCEKKALFGEESFRLIFEGLKKNAWMLLIGISILFLFRVLLQIFYVYLQISPAPSDYFAIFVIFLSGTCRVALPFLLWLALTYRQILPPRLEPEKLEKKKQQLKTKKKTGAKRR